MRATEDNDEPFRYEKRAVDGTAVCHFADRLVSRLLCFLLFYKIFAVLSDGIGGDPADGRKVKGATIHWVDAENCCDAEVRQYSNLFDDPDPDAAGKDFLSCLNPNSLEVLTGCKVEKSLENAKAPASYQFMRLGYFCPDSKDCTEGHLVFNRSVSLKDSFKPTK